MKEPTHSSKKLTDNRPYSLIVKAGDFLFVSGQIGRDPDTLQMASGEIEGQTRQALKNIIRLLEVQGLSSRNIMKVTVFLLDMQDFHAMNSAYIEMFEGNLPARSTIAVKALPSPEALIEIEAVAYTGPYD